MTDQSTHYDHDDWEQAQTQREFARYQLAQRALDVVDDEQSADAWVRLRAAARSYRVASTTLDTISRALES